MRPVSSTIPRFSWLWLATSPKVEMYSYATRANTWRSRSHTGFKSPWWRMCLIVMSRPAAASTSWKLDVPSSVQDAGE